MKKEISFRYREEGQKEEWAGVNDSAAVNMGQFSFDTVENEQAFAKAQFPTQEEWDRYQAYRELWYKRPKTYDPGEAPLHVVVELVSSCNLGCSMCYTVTEAFQSSVVGARRMQSWPVVKAIIDECAELNVPSILFSWRGESTLYKVKDPETGKTYRFADVLKYARDKGILEITCLTNGQLLTEEMIEHILDAEPSWLNFSIDGLENTYNKIRTPINKRNDETYNAFQVVTNNIKKLVERRNQRGLTRPQIRTNSVFPAIADNPQAYYQFMKGIGVDWITVNELRDYREDYVPEAKLIKDWSCQYLWQRITISANGIILPCTGAHNEESALVLGRYIGTPPKLTCDKNGQEVLTDVKEITIKEAWDCEKINQVRQLHKNNKRCEISTGCRNCRNGMVKHGVDWLPDDWDQKKMDWKPNEQYNNFKLKKYASK